MMVTIFKVFYYLAARDAVKWRTDRLLCSLSHVLALRQLCWAKTNYCDYYNKIYHSIYYGTFQPMTKHSNFKPEWADL